MPVDQGRARTAAPFLPAAVLAACFALLSWQGAQRESASFDETFNIMSGRTLSDHGFLPPGQPNPPLLLRSLSVFLPPAGALSPLDEASCAAAPRTCGFRFVYSNAAAPGLLLGRARAASLALGVALLLLCGLWGFLAGGRGAALAAMALFALMPPLLAHSHMATADIGNALFCTAALFLLWRGSLLPSAGAAAAAGLVCGLALAGKYTAALMLPLAAAQILSWGGSWPRNLSAWGGAAVAGLWLGVLPFSPAQWSAAGMAVARELGAGHITYVAGRIGTEGSWYYFPLALLLKTPLPGLMLAAAGFSLFRGLAPALRRGYYFYLAVPAAAWLLLGVFSNTQVGIRHLLPFYPLLCVWGGLAAARLCSAGRPLPRLGTAALFVWLAAGTLHASPWQLSYFNELAGGAGGGHRWLLDSNLDWGQGLKELGAYARRKGAGHIYLSYFGCADPHAYGLKYAPVLMTACTRLPGDGPPPPGGPQLLAVSVTNRIGIYYSPRDLFSWLDAKQPDRIAGNSIWVYDVTGDTEALKMLSFPALARR